MKLALLSFVSTSLDSILLFGPKKVIPRDSFARNTPVKMRVYRAYRVSHV
jgi:hypothetical protein